MTHAEMLREWTNRRTLAAALDVPYGTVQAWELRNSIPQAYWFSIATVARSAGIKGVTEATLKAAAEAAKRAKPPRRNAKTG